MASPAAIQQFKPALSQRNFTGLSTFVLVATDMCTLLCAVAISVITKDLVSNVKELGPYLRLWPFLFVFLATYASVGLYSKVALSPPQELRRVTLSSAVIFLILGAATVTLRGGTRYFTWTLALAVILSVILLPVARAAARHLFAARPWWGTPAVVFGSGAAGENVVRTLLEQPGLGLRPILVVDDEPEAPQQLAGLFVLSGHELTVNPPELEKSTYAVVATPGMPSSAYLSMIERCGARFSRILIIPDCSNRCSLWTDSKNVGGMLGFELHQQAFDRETHWPKHVLDLTLTILGGILVLPLIAFIAIWIKFDSFGPVFYSQSRVGQDGTRFRAWKFRSMVENADQILQHHLSQNPVLREEWERDHKLKDDPRITAVGRFLRRTSLDELPQIWNVLKGEMSLVGPRPIVDAEISKYGNSFHLYTRVRSGLTGLWQVSGRNDTSYDQRVQLDVFYVRNWSVWLDLYILFRTIETVVFRKGAY
jgi:Undecaprenyl-phosphate galactose phosphotransferase WbaP